MNSDNSDMKSKLSTLTNELESAKNTIKVHSEQNEGLKSELDKKQAEVATKQEMIQRLQGIIFLILNF